MTKVTHGDHAMGLPPDFVVLDDMQNKVPFTLKLVFIWNLISFKKLVFKEDNVRFLSYNTDILTGLDRPRSS